MKTRPVLYAAAALALLVSACGSDAKTSTADSSTTASTAASSTTASTVASSTATATAGAGAGSATTAAPRAFPATAGQLKLVDDAKLGKVLADSAGNVLYLYTPDKQGASTCYDRCIKAWPATGKADGVGAGLDAKLLGTTTRTDGSVQATYGSWPLYYFANDKAPGDSNGQGLQGVWYVLGADGKGIGLSG
jgi:predicted lipoprotein with Yx(FWY)xxD motif